MVKDVKLFVDDTVLFPVVDDTDVIRRQEWANQSKKCLLILTELNQLTDLSSLEKLKILFALISTLTTYQLLKKHIKSTWDSAHTNSQVI